jgi:hypothetical protein
MSISISWGPYEDSQETKRQRVPVMELGEKLVSFLTKVSHQMRELLDQGASDERMRHTLGQRCMGVHQDETNGATWEQNQQNIEMALREFERQYGGDRPAGYARLTQFMRGDGGVCVDQKVETLNNFLYWVDPWRLHPKETVMGDVLVRTNNEMCKEANIDAVEYRKQKSRLELKKRFLKDFTVARGLSDGVITDADVEAFLSASYGFPLFASEEEPNVLECDGGLAATERAHRVIVRRVVPWAELPSSQTVARGSIVLDRDNAQFTVTVDLDHVARQWQTIPTTAGPVPTESIVSVALVNTYAERRRRANAEVDEDEGVRRDLERAAL